MTVMTRHALVACLACAVVSVSARDTATTRSIASVYLPNAEQFASGVMGSIVSAGVDRTALELGCPSPSSTDFCGYLFGSTVTYGPSTLIVDLSATAYTKPDTGDAAVYGEHHECVLDNELDVAVCTNHMTTDGTTSRFVRTQREFRDLRTPVTVTAGFEHLQPSPGSSSSSQATQSATVQSVPSSTGQPSSGGPSITGAASGSASSAAAESTTTSRGENGVLPRRASLMLATFLTMLAGCLAV